jgi:uncharacterized OsmC-like protein
MKIILLSDESIRLEPDAGPMTIEAIEPDQQYSPFHMLASSLAYCTFSVMYSWATHTKQSADDLVLEVRWKFSEDEPKRVAELHLTYHWPSLPERKKSAAQRVAQLCTIHATLHHPPTITTEPAVGSAGAGTAATKGAAGTTTPHDTADEADAGAHVPTADASK